MCGIGAWSHLPSGNTASTGWLDGSIQRVTYYNTAVNDNQAAWLASNFIPHRRLMHQDYDVANNPANYGSIVGCWEFREASGTRVDLSRNGISMLDQNTVTAGAASPFGYKVPKTQSNLIRVGDTSDGAYVMNAHGSHMKMYENQTRWQSLPYGGTTFATNIEVQD
jgi:hypothetical protein